ncbi:unnamed protein product, partial [Staurois parvus]
MNDVIPLLHVLEQMLLTMAGQGAVDVAHRSQRHMTPVGAGQEEEEEVEEDIGAQELLSEMGGFSTQRTGVEEQEHLVEEEEEETEDPDAPWQYAVEMEAGSPSHSLAQMAHSMLACLRSDSRIITIRQRDDFWLSTLLDPRYRSKMVAFFTPAEREAKITYYKNHLCSQLVSAFLRQRPSSDTVGPVRSRSAAMAAGEGWGGRSSGSSTSSSCLSLQSMMSSFLHQRSEETTNQPQQQQ